MGFPGGVLLQNLPASASDLRDSRGFDLWVGKIPWRRAWQPTLVFLPGESHRGAWWATVHGVAKSQDTTERLNTRTRRAWKAAWDQGSGQSGAGSAVRTEEAWVWEPQIC